MDKVYKTIGNYDYITKYKFVGYGLSAEPIFAEYETKFNIARGVIYADVFKRYCTEDKKTYQGFVRLFYFN